MTKVGANELVTGVCAEYEHSFIKMDYDLSVNLESLKLMRNKTEAFLSWAKGKEAEEAEYLNSTSVMLLMVFEKIRYRVKWRMLYRDFWLGLTDYSEECREGCIEICSDMIGKLNDLNKCTEKELRKKGIWGKKA